MLTHLRISDFALLDEVQLELGDGFNVLTGETGAGKSLLVDAVALLRGGRASGEVVRAGAEEAQVEAVFEPEGQVAKSLAERLARVGIEPAEEGLIVRRVIGRAAAGASKPGRGRVYVNGAISTAAVLGELAGGLIDLAGQHEHQTLTDPAQHRAILDAYGSDAAALGAMANAHACLNEAVAALQALSLDERARAEREDFLRFQLRELDEAALEPGEDERLKQERERLRAAEKLHGVARRAEGVLYAREGAVVEELGALVRELGEAGRADPSLAKLGQQVEEARVSLEDAAEAFRRYADNMHADPERLQVVEERLHLLGRLLRKHGAEVSEVLARREAMAAELRALGSHEEQRRNAEAVLVEARARAAQAAAHLRAAREAAAESLARRVSSALAELGMSGARLEAQVGDRAAREGDEPALVFDGRRLGAAGWDRVEFLLAANPGEEARPLQRVASGGELSRIMLALKRVLARADSVGTYVFDEVDAGIGGAVADVVGRLLKSVAAEKQVLCVTHLPQIAAWADAHFHVEKRTGEGRTTTVVRRLAAAERVEELARMVGGARVTPKARAHAEELLRQARAGTERRAKG
jgi:DNA repair protein RecN (Recombination protein N)